MLVATKDASSRRGKGLKPLVFVDQYNPQGISLGFSDILSEQTRTFPMPLSTHPRQINPR
jgi:hypothetical protein